MSTIPASELVNVVPSVLGVGGSALDINALVLTTSIRVPVGTVHSFGNGADVAAFFGPASIEAEVAQGGLNLGTGYFGGFEGSTKKPAALLFAQYNQVDVAAYLRSGPVSTLTLAQLQSISGTLNVTADGIARSGSVNLSGATSFSLAAGIIQTALNLGLSTLASFTADISGTTLTVSALGSGALAAGQLLSGVGITPGSTWIVAQLTGPVGGAPATYQLNQSLSIGSEAMTSAAAPVAVSYDSVLGEFVIASGLTGAISTIGFGSGAVATSLSLTSALGAVLSQGAAAASPSAFMAGVIALTTAWVTFMTTFNPDASGNAVKQAFAAWANSQDDRYAYVCWDTDPTPAASNPAAASLGQILAANGNSGTCLVWEPAYQNTAAFICGAAASIDFEKTNGRITFAYKAQSGLLPGVTTSTAALNLAGDPMTGDRANGYNFYGAYATANDNFQWLQRGFVTGAFKWFDSFVNQAWLNHAFKVALLTLLQNALSIPYTTAGYSLIEQALADPIAAGLNFGAFAPGSISASQAATVNQQAGTSISDTLQAQGWYLQVKPASSTARSNRTTPPCTFWYLDRGSVQSISLASIALQ